MKKSITTIAIVLSVVFGISKSTFAASRSNEEATTLTEVSKISKIEVHGNVQLYVSDGTADQVKVYNRYYSETALVQDQNGTLRITSYAAQKLVVWVTVSDLRDMKVYDNASVKSFGKLSAIDLDVKLYNTASAQLNMEAYSANISLNGRATADITGSIVESEIHYDHSATVNITNLSSSHLTKNVNRIEGINANEFTSL